MRITIPKNALIRGSQILLLDCILDYTKLLSRVPITFASILRLSRAVSRNELCQQDLVEDDGSGPIRGQLFSTLRPTIPQLQGAKLSKSRGAFVEVSYFLSKYDADALHFYLTATAPETRDTDFSWEDFVERNNRVSSVSEGHELGATWGRRA